MPTCSIIIPVYNWASVTRQCLNAILADPPEVDTEIIVVDDASSDVTPQMLAGYGDLIRVVTHEENVGFATACNDGAAAATGDFLVFLNNDTTPHENWLDALVWDANAHPQAAAFGAKILNPDGTVQHAGVVVCQDRFTRAIYGGFPADHRAVNQSRRFQAVTGACLLVRRAAFEEVGGFDTGFLNAYEDHDLCLRLGERGHEVRYCHTCVVTHLESLSRTREPGRYAGAVARFRQRWAHRLEPDDLSYYARDGLLTVRYEADVPPMLSVSPQLAVLDEQQYLRRTDRLLMERARQTAALQRENARLAALLLEARALAPPSIVLASAEPVNADPSEGPLHDPVPDPPEELVHLVGGDLAGTGAEFMEYFTSFCRLQPHERVLDVGSGIGRMAIPLTRFLSSEGQYRGFDITERSVRWCQEHITPRYPNFQFLHADVFNRFYNPDGALTAAEFRFPYDDASFDYVFLTSVFTHMLPGDLLQYAREIARVLQPGGRCLITYFLLNDESVGLMRSGFSRPYVFWPSSAVHSIFDRKTPEAAVAYSERHIREVYDEVGLDIEEPIRYGRWCGRHDFVSLQDLVLGIKRGG
jgi:GT2 family glycosyltransferase/SAM-dependent methyltransferase